jgi:hypothetical protein
MTTTPVERVLTPELALRMALDMREGAPADAPVDHPLIVGRTASAGIPVMRARPVRVAGFPDLRVCDGCGASLAGKRRQARYCDDCETTDRKTAAQRRRRGREAVARQLEGLDGALTDYVERVRDRSDNAVPLHLDADDIRDELTQPRIKRLRAEVQKRPIPERQRAAILREVAASKLRKDGTRSRHSTLDARPKDMLAREPLSYMDEAYRNDDANQGSEGLGVPQSVSTDGLGWCFANHATGWRHTDNPPGSLGYVPRRRTKKRKFGERAPKVHRDHVDDGNTSPAMRARSLALAADHREEIWDDSQNVDEFDMLEDEELRIYRRARRKARRD